MFQVVCSIITSTSLKRKVNHSFLVSKLEYQTLTLSKTFKQLLATTKTTTITTTTTTTSTPITTTSLYFETPLK